MIRGIHHVSVVVSDMDKMLAFYTDVLGFTRAAGISWEGGQPEVDEIIGVESSSADVVILRAGNAYLEIFKYHAPPGKVVDPTHSPVDTGIRHFAFDVVDIESEYERLLALGVEFNCPPREVEVEGHPLKAVYFRDPEGNILEFQELLEGRENPMAVPGF
jgi:catechol 2,3-dioxygenase-like lactoylglutathione lyase family enzyme